MPTCLACGAADAAPWAEAVDEEYHTTADRFTYYHCNRCGVLFIDPVPRDRLSTIYPPNYYSFDETVTNSPVFKVKDWLDQRFFRKFISRLPHPSINVLDVGGGTGAQLTLLKKVDRRIRHTAVVDIDTAAGDIARRRGHEYFCGKFEDYTTDRRFELILMLNLIEHVDNPKELLAKARSLLAPQGIVIVKTPNTDSWDARLFRYANWGGYHCPRHWVLFDRDNFTAMAAEAGLRVRHFQYTQGAPFWTTSILFALNRRGWARVTRDRPAPRHPLYPLLNIGFACLDMVRGKLAKTSQMLVILEGEADASSPAPA